MVGTKHFLWVCVIISQKLVFFDQLYILATMDIGSVMTVMSPPHQAIVGVFRPFLQRSMDYQT